MELALVLILIHLLEFHTFSAAFPMHFLPKIWLLELPKAKRLKATANAAYLLSGDNHFKSLKEAMRLD